MAPRFALVPARWLAPDSGLSSTERLVLCVLCQWVNRDTGQAFPSQETIAAHCGLSARAIRGTLENLIHAGAISVTRRFKESGEPDTNLYTVFGYDPPGGVREGRSGRYGKDVPVGTEPRSGRVRNYIPPNVVKENKEVNRATGTAGPLGPPPSGPNRSRQVERCPACLSVAPDHLSDCVIGRVMAVTG